MSSFSLFLFLFLLLISTWSSFLVAIKWSVCISKSQRISFILFFRMDSGLCIYHLVVWSKFNLLHNSQWNIFPTQLCLVLYSLCANLLHLLTMWLIISSLSPNLPAQLAGGVEYANCICIWVKKKERMSWIWHQTISWWSSSNAEALGNVEYPLIAIAPRSTLFLSIDQIELFDI